MMYCISTCSSADFSYCSCCYCIIGDSTAGLRLSDLPSELFIFVPILCLSRTNPVCAEPWYLAEWSAALSFLRAPAGQRIGSGPGGPREKKPNKESHTTTTTIICTRTTFLSLHNRKHNGPRIFPWLYMKSLNRKQDPTKRNNKKAQLQEEQEPGAWLSSTSIFK